MASVQSQVMDAVVERLNGTPWAAYRTRVESFNPAELPAYNVLPGKGDARYLSTDEVTRTFRFTVRHMAAAVNEVDAAIDALYVAGAAAFLSDPTLGGLVRYTRELESDYKLEGGEYDSVDFEVTYEVEFGTERNNPSASVN